MVLSLAHGVAVRKSWRSANNDITVQTIVVVAHFEGESDQVSEQDIIRTR